MVGSAPLGASHLHVDRLRDDGRVFCVLSGGRSAGPPVDACYSLPGLLSVRHDAKFLRDVGGTVVGGVELELRRPIPLYGRMVLADP